MHSELNKLENDGWKLLGVQNVRLENGSLFTVAYLKQEKLEIITLYLEVISLISGFLYFAQKGSSKIV